MFFPPLLNLSSVFLGTCQKVIEYSISLPSLAPRSRYRECTLARSQILFLVRTRGTNIRAYKQITIIQGCERVGPIKSHGAMSRKMAVARDPDWKVATP